MATSLAAVVLAAGAASAQTPPGTAKTTWQPYPAVQLGNVVPPVAARNFPAQPTPPTAPIGSRVVMYNKPSGEVRPVQAVDTPARPVVDTAKVDTPKPPVGPGFTAPDKARVFNVTSDEEMVAELLDRVRKNDEQRFNDLTKEWMNKPNRTEDSRPKPPIPVKAEDYELAVTLRGVAVLQPAVTKPGYAPCQTKLEPGYVVHRRLLFEEKNSERYGWELGMAQPFVSAAYFYKDVLLWPAHLMSTRERYDTSAGKCPAGSPIPYYLYPPQVTIRGGIWEAAAVVGVVMLLP